MPCYGSSPIDSNVCLFHCTGTEREKGSQSLSSDIFVLYVSF